METIKKNNTRKSDLRKDDRFIAKLRKVPLERFDSL
jgi:hypothetical protein